MTPFDYFSILLRGAAMSAAISCLSLVLGTLLAFASGMALYAGGRFSKALAVAYVEIFRGTSLLVQLFWLYYALPLLGFSMPPMLTGILALGLNTGAYGAEIVRGALLSVPRQQHEAALALNFTYMHTLRKIILPQAVAEMLPSFSSLAIQNLKDTALVSMITIADLAFKAQELRNLTQDTASIYGIALLLYFSMALVLMLFMRSLERVVDRNWRRGVRA
jgi:polar amino acid transport system permease protein